MPVSFAAPRSRPLSKRDAAAVAATDQLDSFDDAPAVSLKQLGEWHAVGGSELTRFLCPLTMEPMVDPVVAEDGRTYNRPAIEAWLEDVRSPHAFCSPTTMEDMGPQLRVNRAMRARLKQIADRRQRRAAGRDDDHAAEGAAPATRPPDSWLGRLLGRGGAAQLLPSRARRGQGVQ